VLRLLVVCGKEWLAEWRWIIEGEEDGDGNDGRGMEDMGRITKGGDVLFLVVSSAC